jgi:hypothetical protein
MSTADGRPRVIRLDKFAKRQWDPEYKGLVIKMPMEELEAKVNTLYAEKGQAALADGYAPFCKHIFVPCFLEGAFAEAVPITDENKNLLLSEYQARTEKELSVLVRWFPLGSIQAPKATYLDLILYSREQLIKETLAMGGDPDALKEAEDPSPWGLISIKVRLCDVSLPLTHTSYALISYENTFHHVHTAYAYEQA